MKDVSIRYMGLFYIRKRTYLVLQSIVLALCGIWLIAGLILKLCSPFIDPKITPNSGLGLWDYILILGVLAAVAETLDTIFALRAFRRKEEEAKRLLNSEQDRVPGPADSNIKQEEPNFRQRM